MSQCKVVKTRGISATSCFLQHNKERTIWYLRENVPSYMSLLSTRLQQDVVVVLSHRRVHVCELGCRVLQHFQGLHGVPFIQGLIDPANSCNSCINTSRFTQLFSYF